MEQMNYPDIEKLLPHDHPMILLDRFVERLDNGCICETIVRADGLLSVDDGLPGFVGIELMAQTIAAYSGYTARQENEPVRLGFLIGAPTWQSECDSFVQGQVLRVKVEHVWGDDHLMRFNCEITETQTNSVLQSAELNVYQPDSSDLPGGQDP